MKRTLVFKPRSLGCSSIIEQCSISGSADVYFRNPDLLNAMRDAGVINTPLNAAEAVLNTQGVDYQSVERQSVAVAKRARKNIKRLKTWRIT